MYNRKEIWREYPLQYEGDFENDYKLMVSNTGLFKTYNSHHPEGKIVKGSLQSGFRILRLKLFRKRTAKDLAKIEEIQVEIDSLNQQIKNIGSEAKKKQEKNQLRVLRDELIQKRKKLNHRIDKKRCINGGILFHKAVAELFLDPPSSKDKKFVIHKDFDKLNNDVENLDWANQDELNERYYKHPKRVLERFKKQFLEYKPNVRATKLSENDVLVIKKRLKKGYTLRKLSKQFGVSDMQIHRIKTGENWSHIKLVEDLLEEKENKKWQAT